MATWLKIIGIIIALSASLAMYATIFGAIDQTIQSGSITPTVPNFMKTGAVFIGEIIGLFGGLGIVALSVKICSHHSK